MGRVIKTTVDICDDRALPITESLDAALRTFRYADRERILWADAVAINQQDDEEKSSQVGLMQEVYRKGACTLIWLGHEEDEVVQASLNGIIQWLARKYRWGWRRNVPASPELKYPVKYPDYYWRNT
jgi:hypothetical protein